MNASGEFTHDWRAEVLAGLPLIAPARQFTYPRQVAGEEDAMARGALLVQVHPAAGGIFLATCALGFTDPSMPTDIFSCPNPRELCAVAGGYAYIIDTSAPERFTMIPYRPVLEVRVALETGLLLFVGHHSILAWGAGSRAWESEKLSDEGVAITAIEGGLLRGTGWNMRSDKETAFTLDLGVGLLV